MACTCWSCETVFETAASLRRHCALSGHRPHKPWKCHRCPARFIEQVDQFDHEASNNHFEFGCSVCIFTFWIEADRKNHEIDDHYYCAPCDRYFQNQNNIKQHLNSQLHRGRNILCPFCSKSYTTATGVAHHLESSACPKAPKLNRDEVYRLIRSRDTAGTITKNLLGWTGSTKYQATGRTWNGKAYECYICHRGFGSLTALNQHLNSPTHRQALYHCPKPSCRAEFKTLAGFVNHLESESCGLMRFDTVQTRVGEMLRRRLLIGA